MSNETVVHDPRKLGCCTHRDAEVQIQHNFYMVAIEQRDAAFAKLDIAREALKMIQARGTQHKPKWESWSAVFAKAALARIGDKS